MSVSKLQAHMAEYIEAFSRDGFLVLPRFFDRTAVEAIQAEIDAVKRDRPFDVVIDNLENGERTVLGLDVLRRKSCVFHYFSETDVRASGPTLIWQSGAYWMDRAPQPLPPAVASQLPFSESAYLKRYQDVAAAVRDGALPSGRAHYERYGREEGRLPC